jgi:uncharacterized membrane protein
VAPAAVRRIRIVLAVAVLPFIAAALVGLAVLWPGDGYVVEDFVDSPGVENVSAPVVAVVPVPCEEGLGTDRPEQCGELVVRVDDGSEVTLAAPPAVIAAGIQPGARVQLVRLPGDDGAAPSYEYLDVDRSRHLAVLAAAFAVLVVAVARLRGLAALVGLVIAFWVLRAFMLPALLAGEPAMAVAVVGSTLIMLVALYVAHGVSMRTTTAVLGTMFGLGSTALLGWLVSGALTMTGGGGDDERLLAAVAPAVELRGVILAGLVLAGLGVLNDVTVTQASAVWELHAAHPSRGTRRLFTSAMRIGRDHIASSVYTLVFAYAGASLPLFLLVTVYQDPLGLVVSSEGIAAEIVSMLVGAIGLVLAVPLTTLVGVLVLRAARVEPAAAATRPGDAPGAAPGALAGPAPG